MNVTQAREAIQDLKAGVIRLTGEAMMEHKEQITGLLVHQQYEEGVDSQSRPFKRYKPTTVKMKQADGVYRGFTDLHNTGEFQGSMNLTIDGDEYKIESPARTDLGVLKSRWLTEWNGSEIMDLTKENEALIYPIIEDTLKDKVNSELALD